jgi:hypothetical protein
MRPEDRRLHGSLSVSVAMRNIVAVVIVSCIEDVLFVSELAFIALLPLTRSRCVLVPKLSVRVLTAYLNPHC